MSSTSSLSWAGMSPDLPLFRPARSSGTLPCTPCGPLRTRTDGRRTCHRPSEDPRTWAGTTRAPAASEHRQGRPSHTRTAPGPITSLDGPSVEEILFLVVPLGTGVQFDVAQTVQGRLRQHLVTDIVTDRPGLFVHHLGQLVGDVLVEAVHAVQRGPLRQGDDVIVLATVGTTVDGQGTVALVRGHGLVRLLSIDRQDTDIVVGRDLDDACGGYRQDAESGVDLAVPQSGGGIAEGAVEGVDVVVRVDPLGLEDLTGSHLGTAKIGRAHV